MKTIIVLFAILIAPLTRAEIYFDVGLGVMVDTDYRIIDGYARECWGVCQQYSTYREAENPYGSIEIGYNKNDISLYFLHLSSIPDKDAGLNMMGIKYRFRLF